MSFVPVMPVARDSADQKMSGSQHSSALRPVTELHILTCLFNPARSRRIVENYHTFRRMVGDVPLTVIELIYDDDPVIEPRAIHIHGTRQRHSLWQKERLLNIALDTLPDDVDAVAWFDADIILPPKWLKDSLEALCENMVVQPFASAHWLDATWRTERIFAGYADCWAARRKRTFGHPGFAWIARRSVLQAGLFDLDLVGSSDTWMAYFFSGTPLPPGLGLAPQFFIKALQDWGTPVSKCVSGRLASADQQLIHLHHGRYADRCYDIRRRWMSDAGLEREHIVLDENGLYTIVGNEKFRQTMIDYFPSRKDG